MSTATRIRALFGLWPRHLMSKAYRSLVRIGGLSRKPSPTTVAVSDDRASAVGAMARDPALGLDYVVCGMPRGGTTFFAELLNAHPDLYCYFMETAVFRQLWMFGAERPFPNENLGPLEEWLRGQLKAQLLDATDPQITAKYRLRLAPFLEMLNVHGLAEETGPGLRVFDEDSLDDFIKDLLCLFRQGLHGPALFQAGNRVLGAYLRRRTRRRIVGEKTPDNLNALGPLMAGNPDMQVLCIVREPYTTMESMKRRAQQEDSIFNAAFSGSFFGALADYFGSLATIVSSMDRLPPARFHVIRYEDLLADAEGVLEGVLGIFGLVPTEATRAIASNFIIPTPTAHSPREVFTDQEICLADYVLRPLLRRVGYGDAFFRERGLAGEPDACSGMDQDLIVALSGIRQESPTPTGVDGWMGDKGELLLMYAPERSHLEISVRSDYPSQLGIDSFTLTASNGGREIAGLSVGSGARKGRLTIDLGSLESDPLGPGLRAARLTLSASHAYRPITVSDMGRGMSKLSFLIAAERFQ